MLVGNCIVNYVSLDYSLTTDYSDLVTHKISHVNHSEHMAQQSNTHARTNENNDHYQISICNTHNSSYGVGVYDRRKLLAKSDHLVIGQGRHQAQHQKHLSRVENYM